MFLCNISNVDDAVDRKFVEDKKVSMERSCIGTSSIFKSSNIVADHQKQNRNNDENEFANIFPSLSFPSTPLQDTENIQLSAVHCYKAQIIYKDSYNLHQDIKKNLPAAEIFSVQLMEVKFFAQFVITPLA